MASGFTLLLEEAIHSFSCVSHAHMLWVHLAVFPTPSGAEGLWGEISKKQLKEQDTCSEW